MSKDYWFSCSWSTEKYTLGPKQNYEIGFVCILYFLGFLSSF